MNLFHTFIDFFTQSQPLNMFSTVWHNDKEYWVGPYSVLVPSTILGVYSADGHNVVYREGIQTQVLVLRNRKKDKLSLREYRQKYAHPSGWWTWWWVYDEKYAR